MSEKGFTHCQLWDSLLNLVRRMCSSKRGKIGMAGLMGKTYFDKLRMQLTFSKQSQIVLQLAFFCLTMLPATRNKPQMLSPQGRCQKAHTQHGDTTKKGRKCAQWFLVTITPSKTCISLTTIQQCLAGSRGWKLSSINVGFGQRKN